MLLLSSPADSTGFSVSVYSFDPELRSSGHMAESTVSCIDRMEPLIAEMNVVHPVAV